jgi:hypothetical protein
MTKALGNFSSSAKCAMFGNTASAWAFEMKMPSRQTIITVNNAGPIYMWNFSSTPQLRHHPCPY